MGTLNTYEIDIPGEFGIKMNVPIWIDEIKNFNSSHLIDFANENLIKTKDFLKNFETLDNSIWNKHNIFCENICGIQDLKHNIKHSYTQFCKTYNVPQEQTLYINGWLSILTKECYVEKHCHSMHENNYLSGYIPLLDDGNNTTIFYIPQLEHVNDVGEVHVKSIENSIVMFPQWLFHSVPKISNNLRIVLAFDFFTKKAMDYYLKNNSSIDSPIKRAIEL